MKFAPGAAWTGNRNGRPRKPEIEMFRAAIAEVEQSKKKKLLVHAVEQAFIDNNVLNAILKKILPDKIEDESLKNLARTFLIRSEKEAADKKENDNGTPAK